MPASREPTWLIGAGPMAVEYAKVLQALDTPFKVIGRSGDSARKFEQQIGVSAIEGGVTAALVAPDEPAPVAAIVAVSPAQLAPVTMQLLDLGVARILIEKPGALSLSDLTDMRRTAAQKGAEIQIAYNRRFFASTLRAREIMEDDGGPTSFTFEITEWAHVVGALKKEKGVHAAWFLANTTHVVDLAWFLGGFPEEISCLYSGSLQWHPAASRFSGSGRTQHDALFSYHGDWNAPGRWGLEFCTRRHRLILRPMEKLHIQKLGSIAVEEVTIDYHLDEAYKPGLYLQTERFVSGDASGFCSIDDQIRAWPIYQKMAGYGI